MQNYCFKTRVRCPHKTVVIYPAQLKQLAQYYKLGDTLKQKLRDRLVCGIGEERWQKHLLSKEVLTNDNTVKVLLARERANKQEEKKVVNQIHQWWYLRGRSTSQSKTLLLQPLPD